MFCSRCGGGRTPARLEPLRKRVEHAPPARETGDSDAPQRGLDVLRGQLRQFEKRARPLLVVTKQSPPVVEPVGQRLREAFLSLEGFSGRREAARRGRWQRARRRLSIQPFALPERRNLVPA